MTVEERNTILESADILQALGGNNGFSNLQPKLKKMLLVQAVALKKIVEKDIRANSQDPIQAEMSKKYALLNNL